MPPTPPASMVPRPYAGAGAIRFTPVFGRQAFAVEGRFRLWGGLTLET